MAFVIKDRIKEVTTTTGTGAIALGGASATFDTFQSVLANADTTYYAIVHTTSGVDEWEVGLGTWNTGNTLTRTTVISGSNGTSAVDFQAGTKQIFITMPASKSTILDASGNVDLNGGTIDGTTIGASVAAAADFTTLDTTGDVVVGGELNVTEWIDLTAQTSNPAHAQGRLWYDNIHKTLNYYSDDSGVVHELGIEEHARVYNETGATIAKGTPVYFSGSRSDSGTHVPTVAKANATSSTKYKSEGMTAATIANNSYGFVITAGRLEGLDTSHLSVGQFFTGITDGATQSMPPVYPNFPMCLGFVVRSNASDGVVFLAQQNHSIKTFRVQMDQHIGGDLTIDGDLNVSGSQNTTSTNDVTAGAPFYRANEGDAIGDANTTFTGTGLDDAFFAGHFTGTASTQYYVKIDNVSGAADTFSVSTDNFTSTITTGTAITGSEQMIHSADNISVNFGATTGHTLNDIWTGTAAPVNRDTGFFSNRNTGSSGVGYTHMGLFYDVSESKWRLVDEYDPVPAGTINTGHSSYVTGTIVGNVEGNVTGNVTGAVTGNATSATTLETARDIGGVSFNGSASINLPGVNAAGNQDTSGVAATATALATARTIALSGDVTGSVSFNGTGDVSITSTVLDDSHAHIVSNVDGLQTALDAKAPTARTLTAGAGLTGGGDLTANRTLAHADTSSQASVDGSGRTYIQDITLDTYGHVTGLATATETVVNTTYTAGTNVAISGTNVISSTNTTYSVGDGGLSEINFTSADHTKLNGIATSANNYSFPYTVSTGAGNSTVVQRDGSGYIFGNYYNGGGTFSTTGNTSGMGIFTGTNGTDTYGRSYTAAAARTLLNVANGASANLTGTAASTINTTVERNASGDINVRLVRSEYSSTNATCTYFMTQINQTDNNYIRPSTVAQVKTALGISTAQSSFLRSDTADEASGTINFTGGLNIEGNVIWNGTDTWCRIPGTTGVYFPTYTGGLYQTDSTYVRIYNSKSLQVDSNIRASGNITAYYSDERFKNKTGTIENALEKVESLSGFTYVENELAQSLGYKNEKEQVALSAQDVQKVLPQAVTLAPCDMEVGEFDGVVTSKSGENYLTVDYSRLVPLLVEAIKELKAEVEELKNGSTN